MVGATRKGLLHVLVTCDLACLRSGPGEVLLLRSDFEGRSQLKRRQPLLRCSDATTIVVAVEILASAQRHGISDDDIRHAVENSVAGGGVDDNDFMMLVGPDQSGNILEIGIVVTDDIEYAIHAMRARTEYLEWL